jgi:hypothetical protein
MAVSARTYFVVTSDGQQGPFDRAGLREALAAGRIANNDQVRTGLGTPVGHVSQVLAASSDRTTSARTTHVSTSGPPIGLIIAGSALAVGLAWLLWPQRAPVQVIDDPTPRPATQPNPTPAPAHKPVPEPAPAPVPEPTAAPTPPKPSTPPVPAPRPKPAPAQPPIAVSAASLPFRLSDKESGSFRQSSFGGCAWLPTGPLGTISQLRIPGASGLRLEWSTTDRPNELWFSARLGWVGQDKATRVIAYKFSSDNSIMTSFRFGIDQERGSGIHLASIDKNGAFTPGKSLADTTTNGDVVLHLTCGTTAREHTRMDCWWNPPRGPLGQPHATQRIAGLIPQQVIIYTTNKAIKTSEAMLYLADLRIAGSYADLGR